MPLLTLLLACGLQFGGRGTPHDDDTAGDDTDTNVVDTDTDTGEPPPPCPVTTRHVPADHPTIQAAVDAACDGDTLLVTPGTYAENIDFGAKTLHLRSVMGRDVTLLDGGFDGTVVRLAGGTVQGFTIRNGASQGDGGGVSVAEGPEPVLIQDCELYGNVSNAGSAVVIHHVQGQVDVLDLSVHDNRGGVAVFAIGNVWFERIDHVPGQDEGLSYNLRLESDNYPGRNGIRDLWVHDGPVQALQVNGDMPTTLDDIELADVAFGIVAEGSLDITRLTIARTASGGLLVPYSLNARFDDIYVEGAPGTAVSIAGESLEIHDVTVVRSGSYAQAPAFELSGDGTVRGLLISDTESTAASVHGEWTVTNATLTDSAADGLRLTATWFDSLVVDNVVLAHIGGTALVSQGDFEPVVRYTDLWDVHAEVHGELDLGADGLLRVDPGFVDRDPTGPASAWDLHLDANSALIDAGDPEVLDLDGTRSDLGAYGGPAPVSAP